MRKIALFLLFTLSILSSSAQTETRFLLKDSLTNELLTGVVVILDNSANTAISEVDGFATIRNIPNGLHTLRFSLLGYKTKTMRLAFPYTDEGKWLTVFLSEANQELEEVIVSSTRINSRIDDLPTKIEVLGQEDMDEESTIVPGSVTSILGDLSIITIQKTSPINGNEGIRMQGLDPRYTQIMRDGLPLYGGFSGSLGVLSIPPLDLKQVEIIKGSASTLYGGGAISGLINFISKTPGDSLLTTVTLNANTLKETNFNAFSSAKKKKLGFTLFAGLNSKIAADINKDGFTEVPTDQNISLHPRLFYDFDKKNKLILGVTSVVDSRKSGDLQAVQYKRDSLHNFLEKEKTTRNTVDASYVSQLNSKNNLSVKLAFSSFQRNSDYSGFLFNATQNSTYAELSDLISFSKHTLVAGLNLNYEQFRISKSDSVLFGNYTYSTPGIFLQDDWQIREKLSLQAGLRFDRHSVYSNFVLPRLSLFYKASPKISFRLAAGSGYKTPNLFDFSAPSSTLSNFTTAVKPEKSIGSNADINFHTYLFEKLSVQLNEALYYTHIENPVILTKLTSGESSLMNGNYFVNSYGTDTYVRLSYEEVELYLGYNHTEALQQNSLQNWNMPFNPKDKFSTTLAYEIEGYWRMGAEASFTGNQYIYSNKKVNNFWFVAAMVERKFKQGSVVLNCENLLDERQSGFETLVDGSVPNPVFKPIWGPLEGRVINLSVKLNL